jgi:putative methionine-R-sulfoxide reductase with GAF domain
MAADLAPGQRIGDRYEIVAPLSSGAMGAVYEATDSDGMRVAVKHLIDERQADRFEIEARLLASLRHPRVVRVLDSLSDEAGSFLVMELVEGRDLHRELGERGGPGLPVEDAVEYVRQACEAIHYVHGQQIVHRDVKPQNLILGPEGLVLVDFGVARGLDVDQGTVAIGTPRFMAPEVMAGGSVTARSDIYSLAATLWTLLCGDPPRYADGRKLSQMVSGISPAIEDAIAAGLDLLPDRRIASAEAFAQALGSGLEQRGESLAVSIDQTPGVAQLTELIVRTAARVFEAASCSIALTDPITGELVYHAAWGAGAREVVGVRIPRGTGLAGAAVVAGKPEVVSDCRADPRFQAGLASRVGYIPHTMVVVPLWRDDHAIGALSILDRRDGGQFDAGDMERADLFAELAVTALSLAPDEYPTDAPPSARLPVD